MEERAQSSSHRELVAMLNVLKSLCRFIKGTTVKLHTDSEVAFKIFTKGTSNVSALHRIGVEIFWFCASMQIILDVTWVPRTLNQLADHLSKVYDRDDWQTSEWWFTFLLHKWGPFTIDRFATEKNALLPRFNSGWYCPGCEDIDSLKLLNWAEEMNWCNPPFRLMGQLFRVMKEHKAKGAIVVPVWTKRHWWPMLCPDGEHFAGWVLDFIELPTDAVDGFTLFAPGAGRSNEAHVGPPKFRVIAVRVDFSVQAGRLGPYCGALFK